MEMNFNQHISGQFNADLEAIRNHMMSMGGLVERQVNHAVQAICSGDTQLADDVIRREDDVDKAEVAIDNECTQILVRRQPAASDLRMVLAVSRVVRDLERIGDEASKIALNAIARAVIPDLLNNTPFTKILEKGIQNANQDILDYTAKNPEASGMGTTSVCAVVKDNQIHLANVGDSRAYKISDEIHQVTKDHSYVQEKVDSGEITKDQAREDPRNNEITKAVGLSSSLEVDTMKLTLDSDESLLLCCDGVNDHLSDDEIQKIVRDSPDPDTACKKIVDMANEKGGLDNISLIILSAEESDKQVESKSEQYNGKVVEIPSELKNKSEPDWESLRSKSEVRVRD